MREIKLFKKDGVYCVNRQDEDIHVPTRISDKLLKIGNIPVFGTGGYMLSVNDYLYDGESVFIGRKGTINKPFYFSGKFWTVDTLFYTHSFIDVLPKFVYGLFQNINWDLYNEASGVPSLSKSTIEKIKCKIPSTAEQQKITKLLFLLDERIATQNKIIEDLKKLKVAIRDNELNLIRKQYGLNSQISDLLEYEQPTKYIVTDTEYSGNNELTPVLTANKAFILGYTEETNGIYNKGMCIILDDFTLDSKFVNFPFKVKSSAIKILTSKNNISLRYVFEYLNYQELETSEHKRHYISEIEPMMISYPTDEKIISNFCKVMDLYEQKIEIENKYLQSLLFQKAYLLSNMFI